MLSIGVKQLAVDCFFRRIEEDWIRIPEYYLDGQ